MTVRIADISFDHVAYDREVDVLYLHVGDPADAVEFDATPDGHHLRFDGAGRLVGITLLHPKEALALQEAIVIGDPLPEPITIGPAALDEVLAAA